MRSRRAGQGRDVLRRQKSHPVGDVFAQYSRDPQGVRVTLLLADVGANDRGAAWESGALAQLSAAASAPALLSPCGYAGRTFLHESPAARRCRDESHGTDLDERVAEGFLHTASLLPRRPSCQLPEQTGRGERQLIGSGEPRRIAPADDASDRVAQRGTLSPASGIVRPNSQTPVGVHHLRVGTRGMKCVKSPVVRASSHASWDG